MNSSFLNTITELGSDSFEKHIDKSRLKLKNLIYLSKNFNEMAHWNLRNVIDIKQNDPFNTQLNFLDIKGFGKNCLKAIKLLNT